MSEEVSAAVDRDFNARVDACIDRMHDASQNIVGSSASAAAICRDVLGPLWERRTALVDELTSDALLMATRQRSLEHLRANGWDAPGDDTRDGVVDHRQRASASHDSPAIRYRVALAHAGAVVQGAGNTSLVDLHGRHGVGEGVLGDALGATGAAVALRLAQLREQFGDAVAAFTMWNGGRPSCAALAASFGQDSFDDDAFDAVDRHRRSCAECAREYRSIVNPAGLFLTSRVARVAPAVRRSMLPFVTDTAAVAGAGWLATTASAGTAATSADEIVAARRPGEDDDIAELWASAAPAVRTSAVPVATPVRRRSRPSTEIILAGGLASLAVVAGGAALVAGANAGNDRVVIDTPVDTGRPPQADEDPEVRSLGPVPPPTSESTDPALTSTTADSTTTSTSPPTTVAAAGPERSTVPPTSSGTRVAGGVPPVPTGTSPSPTSTGTTAPPTTAEPETPTTTETTITTEPATTTETTVTVATTDPATTIASTTTTTSG